MENKEFDALIEELRGLDFTETVDEILSTQEPAPAPVVEKTPAKKKAKSRSSICDSELHHMFGDIQEKFGMKPFKNKDLAEMLDNWNLTARQTPSRLKKLVEAELLEDLGGSPKSYKVY